MNSTIRPFRAQDLGRVLRLWEEPAPLSAGDGLTGSHVFKTPGANNGGDSDWVLVLTAPEHVQVLP